MKPIMSLCIILLFCIVITSCSEDKNPLPSVTHPDGWNTKTTDSFHGNKVLESGYDSCKGCHGVDLKGGETGYSCFDCHQTYPHPDEWNAITDDNFHGEYIEDNAGSVDFCKGCHGSDLQGGRSGVSCYSCHQEGEWD